MRDRASLSPLRAAVTVLASLATLVGVPLFLAVAVGWPLPRSIPSSDELVQAFQRQGVPVEVVMKILAVVAWVAWSQLVWATLIETIAYARGRSAAGRALAPAAQQAARQFVTAVAFLAGTLASIRPAPAVTATPPVIAAASSMPATAVGSSPPGGVQQQAVPVAERVHEVVHGDTFWGLAEGYLGSGLRWREIRDHNVGRAVAPGRVLGAAEDALDIGWRLVIPAAESGSVRSPTRTDGDAVSAGSGQPSKAPSPALAAGGTDAVGAAEVEPTEVVVQRGDSLWHLAERRLSAELGRPASEAEVGGYWTDVVEANRRRLVNRLDPDRIYAGQRIELPPVAPPPGGTTASRGRTERPPPEDVAPTPPPERTPAPPERPPPDTRTAPDDTTTQPTAPEAPHDERAPVGDAEHDDSEGDNSIPAGAVLAGATSALLAVGTVRAIRRRRQRRNHLAPSTVPIAGGDADLHRRLVADADEDLTEGLGSALDDLAEQVAVAGHTCRPLVVQHSADHLDALLDQPTLSPVDRWRAQANGEVWTLDTEVPLPIGAEATARMATPLLVTLGPPDDGGQLYLDLEAARLVSLTGDPEVARCLACTMVTELAHSPLAANVRVTVVGDGLGAESLDHLERVRVKKTWADIAADLTSWNDQSHDALVANGWPNPFAGRGHDPDHDALIPLVVVASKPPDDLETVASLTAGPAATAAVVIGDPLPGATVIECRHDRLSLPGLGLTCQPLALQPEEVDRVASLLDSADEPGGEQLVIWPDEDPGPLVSGDGPNEEYRDPPYELLVRFLGDIAVETADGGPTRLTEKQTALVAYIALRREISVDRVADAVWTTPAAGSPRKRLANAMSRCREAIGDRYLPASDGRTYRIGPGMATDVDLFERRVAAAGKMRPDQAVDVLEGALNLVRGRVFTYPSKERDSYAWIDAELWVSTWELTIAAVAQRAAVMSLDLGDPARAVRMTEHILRDAVSTHPGLTESLMRAHAANGDRQAVHRVYQAHVNALEKLDLDSVAESTADLYERLRGG